MNPLSEPANQDNDWPLPTPEVLHELQGPEVIWQPDERIEPIPARIPALPPSA